MGVMIKQKFHNYNYHLTVYLHYFYDVDNNFHHNLYSFFRFDDIFSQVYNELNDQSEEEEEKETIDVFLGAPRAPGLQP
eukprot:10695271-Heterocapsa_arctica.AAC.1